MFICNHCPYVKAVIDRIVRDANELRGARRQRRRHLLQRRGALPGRFLRQHEALRRSPSISAFPYLYDESQDVARAYGAACTPDFFGFNGKLELQYRGRLDESRKEAAPADVRRDLFEAMKQIAETGEGPARADPLDRLLHQMESRLDAVA